MQREPTKRKQQDPPLAVLFVRLPASLKQVLVDEAKRRGVSHNKLALDLLEQPLAEILAGEMQQELEA